MSPWFFDPRHHKKEKIIYQITFLLLPIFKQLSAEREVACKIARMPEFCRVFVVLLQRNDVCATKIIKMYVFL